jgi:virulence factor Mce-like protein
MATPTGTPRKRKAAGPFDNPVLLGTLIVLAFVVGTFIAYSADKGLPFVPTYDVKVDVPNAAKLVAGDEVRIGGARVGIVKKIDAEPGTPPYAQLSLALNKNERLPVNTVVQVRPKSILGEKYLSVTPGNSPRKLEAGSVLPLSQARGTVEIDDAFKTFDAPTRRGIQGVIGGLGDALAGRGADLNTALGAVAGVLPPLQHLAAILLSPHTDLPGFISGLDQFSTALAPAAPQLGDLVVQGDTTLAALERADSALGQTIDALPGVESAAAPVLADAASIARALQPAARLLPTASHRLGAALAAGPHALRLATTLAPPLSDLVDAINAVVPPQTATLGNSLTELSATVGSLSQGLAVTNPAQISCNVFALLLRNFGSVDSQGDAGGSWLSLTPLLGSSQNFQSATPDPQLHSDYYPTENASGCQAGNEPYAPGQSLAPPTTGIGHAVDQTSAPASATASAQAAGLLAPISGERP